jgi:endonuclease YncB( thermonuclease family)
MYALIAAGGAFRAEGQGPEFGIRIRGVDTPEGGKSVH